MIRAIETATRIDPHGTEPGLARRTPPVPDGLAEKAQNRKKKQAARAAVPAIRPVQLEAPAPKLVPGRAAVPEIPAATLLDLVHMVLTYWARWDTPEQADIATLWTASTHFTGDSGKLLFNSHPRLFFIADKGSGKTRAMKLIRAMVKDPTGIVKAPVTAPGLRDALEAGRTVFLDEIDRQIGRGMGHLDVQSLISAYEADTGSLNGKGGYNEQSVFGPMVLAAKPRIMTGTGGYIDDLFERSFIITPPRHTGRSDPIPDLDGKFGEVTEPIPRALAMWGEAVRPEEGNLWPVHDIPRSLTGRAREISLPLLAVADRAVNPDVIAENGSDLRWALRGREAVKAVLVGHGSNAGEIITDITGKLAAMGVKLP